ncbi:hypothetical protein MPH_10024 [Macrophomina phaseolina MS6]|uniref:Uncharacterized protein n=1 Tax=Macrophomina phaseolina (strain MS6) TaxID=1126212 RepID=K2QSA9_MACPH|nr:hypothetical protein MPH_10024 [Macrophomina phaseolina MS6]
MVMPQYRLRSTCPRATRIASIRAATASQARSLHASRALCGATKEDHLDRTRLNPTSTEYSKSGSDDKSAAMEDAAFNPNKTSPESEVATAEQESGEGSNPLDVSPGNKDVSATKDPQKGGPDRSPGESEGPTMRSRTSGKGSPQKHGGGRTGGGAVP